MGCSRWLRGHASASAAHLGLHRATPARPPPHHRPLSADPRPWARRQGALPRPVHRRTSDRSLRPWLPRDQRPIGAGRWPRLRQRARRAQPFGPTGIARRATSGRPLLPAGQPAPAGPPQPTAWSARTAGGGLPADPPLALPAVSPRLPVGEIPAAGPPVHRTRAVPSGFTSARTAGPPARSPRAPGAGRPAAGAPPPSSPASPQVPCGRSGAAGGDPGKVLRRLRRWRDRRVRPRFPTGELRRGQPRVHRRPLPTASPFGRSAASDTPTGQLRGAELAGPPPAAPLAPCRRPAACPPRSAGSPRAAGGPPRRPAGEAGTPGSRSLSILPPGERRPPPQRPKANPTARRGPALRLRARCGSPPPGSPRIGQGVRSADTGPAPGLAPDSRAGVRATPALRAAAARISFAAASQRVTTSRSRPLFPAPIRRLLPAGLRQPGPARRDRALSRAVTFPRRSRRQVALGLAGEGRPVRAC
jgi:hypothetical protein